MRHDPIHKADLVCPRQLVWCLLLVGLFCTPVLSFGRSIGPSLSSAPQKPSPKTATISNLRYYGSTQQHRLVFDLGRPVTYTQQHVSNPDQVVINLANAVLSKAAKRKLDEHMLPTEIEIKQMGAYRVQITLNMEDMTGLKLQPLRKPYRLLLVYAPKRTIPAAAQPKITLPPVIRQSTEVQRQARLDIDTIILDPGHGGRDPGAIGRSGLMEKEVVLDVALRLRELLKDRLGKNALMTRTTDVFIELDDRAKFANGQKADLFVSIHINSHPSPNVRGIELYHFGIASDRRAMQVAARENGDTIDHARDLVDLIKADLALSKRIEESQNLAWETKLAIVNLVGTAYNLDDHGVKTAPFYVLRYTAMPSILAELSFISNSSDEKLLRASSYRQKMAEALFEGIRNYLNSAQVASAK
ncbi:MAG TPA: N-acetylmuramoyl-L-alanine amidase [Nitrospirales bacterium]